MATFDQVQDEAIALLRQFYRQVSIHDILLKGEAISTAAHAGQNLAFMFNSLTAIDLSEFICIGQYKCAEFTFYAFRFLLDQCIASDEIAFVQVHAKAKPRFIRCGGRSQISGEILKSLFQTQRIKRFISTEL